MKNIEAREDFNPEKEIPSLEGKVLFISGGEQPALSCGIDHTNEVKVLLESEQKPHVRWQTMDLRTSTSPDGIGRQPKRSSLILHTNIPQLE